MILHRLDEYYDILSKRNEVPRYGWSAEQISYGLNLDLDGTLVAVVDLRENRMIGRNRWGLLPKTMEVPMRHIRTKNFCANFLWDNAGYLLGLVSFPLDKVQLCVAVQHKLISNSLRCFEVSQKLHESLPGNADDPNAKAILRFFKKWKPDEAGEHPVIAPLRQELETANLTFLVNGVLVIEDEIICRIWSKHYEENLDGEYKRCLVTGQMGHTARLHPRIKGIYGASPIGLSLISFNQDAFSSWGHEKEENAPILDRTAFACATALNHLTTSRHAYSLGGITFVYWSEHGKEEAQNAFSLFLMEGKLELPKELNGMFYILGMKPNGTRLSVCFWEEISARALFENLAQYQAEFNRLQREMPTLSQLLQELVPESEQSIHCAQISSMFATELLKSVICRTVSGDAFLRALLHQIFVGMGKINFTSAAMLTLLLKQTQPMSQIQEVLNMELNEQNDYLPYLLGQLFAIYDLTNRKAIPNAVVTLKHKYFRMACSTPARTFPTMEKMNDFDLQRLRANGWNAYWENEKRNLIERIHVPYPQTLCVEDMGVFTLGYYHQLNRSLKKKEAV